jgi:hypothetical protein
MGPGVLSALAVSADTARLTLPHGFSLSVRAGDQLHRVASGIEFAELSPRLTLDGQAVPRRKGLALRKSPAREKQN